MPQAGGIISNVSPNSSNDFFNNFLSYNANKALQEDAQVFNTNAASIAHTRNLETMEKQYNYNLDLAQKSFENQVALDSSARSWQAEQNAKAMAHSSSEAAAQRAWEQEMSSSAISRQMQDLRNSGLNPILAASYMGASTSSGASGIGFANGASASGVASGNVSLPSTAKASSGISHASGTMSELTRLLDVSTNFVSNYLNNARRVSYQADKMVSSYAKFKAADSIASKASKASYGSVDDFFDAAVSRAFRDLAK